MTKSSLESENVAVFRVLNWQIKVNVLSLPINRVIY